VGSFVVYAINFRAVIYKINGRFGLARHQRSDKRRQAEFVFAVQALALAMKIFDRFDASALGRAKYRNAFLVVFYVKVRARFLEKFDHRHIAVGSCEIKRGSPFGAFHVRIAARFFHGSGELEAAGFARENKHRQAFGGFSAHKKNWVALKIPESHIAFLIFQALNKNLEIVFGFASGTGAAIFDQRHPLSVVLHDKTQAELIGEAAFERIDFRQKYSGCFRHFIIKCRSGRAHHDSIFKFTMQFHECRQNTEIV